MTRYWNKYWEPTIFSHEWWIQFEISRQFGVGINIFPKGFWVELGPFSVEVLW